VLSVNLILHRSEDQYFIIDGIKKGQMGRSKVQTRYPFSSKSKGPAAELRWPDPLAAPLIRELCVSI